MAENAFDDLKETFGDNEGQYEAGVFALTPTGWKLVSRRKFTQFGTATDWSKVESKAIGKKLGYERMRMAILASDQPQTLEDVEIDYEQKRLAGDKSYCEREPEPETPTKSSEKGWDDDGIDEVAYLKSLANVGECIAAVCVEIQVGENWEVSIACKKTFSKGIDGHQWSQYQERKHRDRKEVRAVGTSINPVTTSDESIIEEFKQVLKERRGG